MMLLKRQLSSYKYFKLNLTEITLDSGSKQTLPIINIVTLSVAHMSKH